MAQQCKEGWEGAARVVPPPAVPCPSRNPNGMPTPSRAWHVPDSDAAQKQQKGTHGDASHTLRAMCRLTEASSGGAS